MKLSEASPSPMLEFIWAFFGCLAVGVSIGILQSLFAFWREGLKEGQLYLLFLAVQATFIGGFVGLIEGLVLYVVTSCQRRAGRGSARRALLVCRGPRGRNQFLIVRGQ